MISYPEKYLHSTFKNGQIDGGRIEYVRLFSLVAVFILLIACINFMNLATARSTKRAKEVGVRKVIGAARPLLMAQFMGEAMLLTFFSIVLAILLTTLLLPAFNDLTGKQLSLPVRQPLFWTAMLGLLLLAGLCIRQLSRYLPFFPESHPGIERGVASLAAARHSSGRRWWFFNSGFPLFSWSG